MAWGIQEAAKQGKTNSALSAMEAQRRPPAGLMDERAGVKAERASLAAKNHGIETEATPIRYVVELIAADTDSERAIR